MPKVESVWLRRDGWQRR